jgi:hypothetical protein
MGGILPCPVFKHAPDRSEANHENTDNPVSKMEMFSSKLCVTPVKLKGCAVLHNNVLYYTGSSLK